MDTEVNWKILYGVDYKLPKRSWENPGPSLSALSDGDRALLVGAMRRDLQLDKERAVRFTLFGFRVEIFRNSSHEEVEGA